VERWLWARSRLQLVEEDAVQVLIALSSADTAAAAKARRRRKNLDRSGPRLTVSDFMRAGEGVFRCLVYVEKKELSKAEKVEKKVLQKMRRQEDVKERQTRQAWQAAVTKVKLKTKRRRENFKEGEWGDEHIADDNHHHQLVPMRRVDAQLMGKMKHQDYKITRLWRMEIQGT
jgi:hypothetical protein